MICTLYQMLLGWPNQKISSGRDAEYIQNFSWGILGEQMPCMTYTEMGEQYWNEPERNWVSWCRLDSSDSRWGMVMASYEQSS